MDEPIHDPDDGTASANDSEQFLRASSPTFLLPVTTANSAGRNSPPSAGSLGSIAPTKAKAHSICDLDLHSPVIGPYHHHLLVKHHHQHHYHHLQLSGSVKNGSISKSPTVTKASIEMRDNYCFYRLQRFVSRNPVLNYLLPLCAIAVLVFVIYAFRDYAKTMLYWIETQNSWIIFCIFLCLFTIVSFPVTVGYLVLIITSGYLFGFIKGLLTVVIGANLGVAIAHNTIKGMQSKLPLHKLIKNETGRAILRVISGPRAFKIVLFARLTPIPFGLQNTIFGISAVNSRSYHTGTVIGLLPAQTINVYLGSKLRSIHEVLNDHNAALGLAGYGVFVVEVVVGAALMVWVIQKARTELSAALLSDMDSDEKILIEVEA
ncbi:AAEL000649-PA [Aedes aegypti]|uniref:VTT domain-containing protein n=2 Tax=Aedes aegypti TaxID=7159 RepID=Q17NM9_AEDAE|nr:transmembrane protein 64 [Aedes aegypti]XP_021710545.1 transmembrane protein 64 [Aedes aegypti]XP_021710546.1 transmembrane protein 64 [Aedes aegypti]XP_021710547.1 transmembrane protein 64 [Aedes aegypti]XP_021710548.1 transmembrane protein 64 [Aedes aegypti]XP_021710549.1 transmembrane protein 64 [Aedes aegypti]XP_021710550.1 transmembrane protein 64 [Aedes aegypti]EAT48284.1 AAEL000649-PA [Aedes aegypti]